MSDPANQNPRPSDEDPTTRFRRLTSGSPGDDASSHEDDAHPETGEDAKPSSPDLEYVESEKRESGFSDHTVKELREKGYVIEEDIHGIRITGAPAPKDSSNLSPYDIVRMAADLDGGVISKDQLRKCPKCDATLQAGADSCQWCGEKIE